MLSQHPQGCVRDPQGCLQDQQGCPHLKKAGSIFPRMCFAAPLRRQTDNLSPRLRLKTTASKPFVIFHEDCYFYYFHYMHESHIIKTPTNKQTNCRLLRGPFLLLFWFYAWKPHNKNPTLHEFRQKWSPSLLPLLPGWLRERPDKGSIFFLCPSFKS